MRIVNKSWLTLLVIPFVLIGCPGPVEVSDDCALEYAVALIDVAGEDAVCDAVFDAVSGVSDQFDALHTEVWNDPSEDLLEDCSDDVDVRVELLGEEQLFRLRCILECDGHDPDAC